MNDTVLLNPKKLLEYLRVSTSIMKSPGNSFSRQELSNSLEMMDVLSDGELLYNLIQSKKDAENNRVMPFHKMQKETNHEEKIQEFADLTDLQKIKVTVDAAKYLYCKEDLKRTFEIMDIVLDEKYIKSISKYKNQSKCNCVLWGKVREEMKNISLHIQQDL